MTIPAVLRTLARLTPSEPAQADATKAAGLVWLGSDDVVSDVLFDIFDLNSGQTLWTPRPDHRPQADRLKSFDALHRKDELLRMGWAFLCGPVTIRGRSRRVCQPLVSRPVSLFGGRQSYVIEVLATYLDWAPAPLLTDVAGEVDPHELRLGEIGIKEDLRALGFGDVPVLTPEHDPRDLIGGDRLVVVLGGGLYAGEPPNRADRRVVLRTWADARGVEATALAALYSSPDASAEDREDDEAATDEVGDDTGAHGALPLSTDQRKALAAARRAPLTVIAGPPGSGKTHTLAAIALDAVASGGSVLLVSRTRSAADALGEALRRAGGPMPVLFGNPGLRRETAQELLAHPPITTSKEALAEVDRARRSAIAAVTRVEGEVVAALRDEELAEAAVRFQALMPGHRSVAPRVFEDGADFELLHRLLHDLRDPPRRGLFGGSGTRRRLRSARRLMGAADDADPDDLEAAVVAAEQSAALLRVAANGGTSLTALRDLLAEGDANLRATVAAWLAALATSWRGIVAQRALMALTWTLRRERTARSALAGVPVEGLVRALPLWVGRLADVEAVLPAALGLFDLVVVDEASHVDQPLAASALLRGRRAVIGGDPRQLRHVSFVGDRAMRDAMAAEGTESLADRLDVPKVSLFDVGAAVAGVHWLTEHHRSAPHLIGFAARKFYDGRLALLTTHPAIVDRVCIEVEHVEGARDDQGVNAVEVDAVLTRLRRRIAAGVRSIGVVTPFRAQADALEQALLDRVSSEEITTGGVRVGTAHGVQGAEFDEVVISLALTDDDPPAAWRFAGDPSLLAVLTTRARRLVHVITSATEPDGLVGDYLRHAKAPPAEVEGVAPTDEWTRRLAAVLTGIGLTVRTGYPVGPWRVDLVVGDRASAVAVETRPHPDGPAAHLARWRALRGAGWRVHDAFPSRFAHDPARAAVELTRELRE